MAVATSPSTERGRGRGTTNTLFAKTRFPVVEDVEEVVDLLSAGTATALESLRVLLGRTGIFVVDTAVEADEVAMTRPSEVVALMFAWETEGEHGRFSVVV